MLVIGILFAFSLVGGSVYAARPYFKSFGGDVMTGGWFRNGTTCSPGGNYQDPNFTSSPTYPASNLYGGIQAYAKSGIVAPGTSGGGASTEFAAFALGLVDGAGPEDGFYSSGALAPISVKRLTFADTTNWGGLFQGTVRQSHCIPDYFNTKQNTSPAPSPYGGNLSGLGSGQHLASNPGGIAQVPGGVISPGENITLFVDGNVYIGSNITYGAGYTENNVPKFALVAKGSIYIGPGVSRLDGVYIAQPDNPNDPGAVASQSGVIWTCHPNNNDPLLDNYPNTACNSQLVVNGAFIAKQINLLRTRGDVSLPSAGPQEDILNQALGSINIAEIFNYTPEMVLGGGFFDEPTASTTYKVQSLVSLPPVF